MVSPRSIGCLPTCSASARSRGNGLRCLRGQCIPCTRPRQQQQGLRATTGGNTAIKNVIRTTTTTATMIATTITTATTMTTTTTRRSAKTGTTRQSPIQNPARRLLWLPRPRGRQGLVIMSRRTVPAGQRPQRHQPTRATVQQKLLPPRPQPNRHRSSSKRVKGSWLPLRSAGDGCRCPGDVRAWWYVDTDSSRLTSGRGRHLEISPVR